MTTTDEPTTAGGRRSLPARVIVVAAVVAVLFAVTVAIVGRPSTEGPAAAKPFDLESITVPDTRIALSDFGGRPLVVNFFASWCVPCRTEMPAFERVYTEVGDRVAFLGIDHQDTRPAAVDLLHETGVTYPTAFDPGGSTALDYELVGMPSTVFIDTAGTIVERRTGRLGEDELRADVDRLFHP